MIFRPFAGRLFPSLAAFALCHLPASGELQDNLLAYWPLDGDFLDASDTGADGTFSGTAAAVFHTDTDPTHPAKFGQGIFLDGIDQYIRVTGVPATTFSPPGGTISISAWFSTPGFSKNWQCLISKGEGTAWRVARQGGNPNMSYAGGVGDIGGGPSVENNGLHHVVAISEQGVSTRLWVDGALAATGGAPNLEQGVNVEMLIGNNADSTTRSWQGIIDDVGIWNRVLTPAEIGDIWNGGTGASIASFLDPGTDTDGDGMTDLWETNNGLDPNVDDAGLDADGDGRTNLQENQDQTDPQNPDTDGDGLNDGAEATAGTNPKIADTDGDGLTDGEEVNLHGTLPLVADTDGDGFDDGREISGGSNPNDASSVPPRIPVLHYPLDVQNGSTVENLGTDGTPGALGGGAGYGLGPDLGYGTAFVGDRTGTNTGTINTGRTAAELGLAGDDWTCMAWVFWDGVSGGTDSMIFGTGGSGQVLHLGSRGDPPQNIHLGVWGAGDVGDAGTIPVGVWTHVTFSRSPDNNGTNSVFVNGLPTASQTNKAGENGWADKLVTIGFGRDGSFNGLIDEVKIFDRALASDEILAEMGPTSAINTFTATPSLSFPGGPVTLNWDVATDVTSIAIDQGVGSVFPTYTGSFVIPSGPAVTTDYELTIGLPEGGTETATVTVTVQTDPIIDFFTATPNIVEPGGEVILNWAVRNTVSLDLDGNDVTGATTTTVNPAATGTYTLTATNASGTTVEEQLVAVVIPGEPLISEFQASNSSTLTDEDGDSSDWIQISNLSSSPAIFNNYYLTDDPDVLTKWAIPFMVLNPGESFLVFASGKDRAVAGAELHSNFLLNSSGEYLALVKVSGGTTILSEFNDYPEQFEDFSYGLASDGVTFGYFTTPTPTGANGPALTDYVRDTTFSVDRGFYDVPFSVEITSNTLGASFRYTTDGSPPSETVGTPYTGPIPINTTTTLRVIGYKANHIPTNVDTQTYVFLDDVLQQPSNPAGFPTDWNGHTPDYEMDPDVVNNPLYSGTLKDDLKSIPSISIVTRVEDMFGPSGIYSNPNGSGSGWERAGSMEYFFGDNSPGYQANCAVRMQGGVGRNTQFEKHSFRLLFKRGFGPTKLNYPIFADATYDGYGATDKFDTITLRSQFNNSWHRHSASEENRAQFLRDQFMHDTQLAMGHASPHGTFVHLYVNGLYWGLYNVVERPNADFASSYYGGKKADWDALNSYPRNVVDGNANSWVTAHNIANAGVADQAGYDALAQYVDIPNLIDYMILNFYGGNQDWDDHNWYSASNRVGGGGYKFFSWDAERSLENENSHNKTGVGQSDKPSRLYSQLKQNPEFRIQFADHAHRHCFNGGVLTPAKSAERYQVLADRIDRAIVGESARWGDSSRTTDPYTRNDEWVTERERLFNNYFPVRTNVFLNQLRNHSPKLYPDTDAPAFSQHGGQIASTTELVITKTSGQIYYTLDGADPRLPGGAINPLAINYVSSGATPLFLAENATVKARVLNGGEWSALNEASFVVDAVAADASNFVVSEFHYRPLPPTESELEAGPNERSDFEFIEVMNVGPTDIDLTGVRFVAGVTFNFDEALTGILLPSGGRVVIVNNMAGFTERYPSVPASSIAGVFSGNLNDDGETITILDADDFILHSFTYNDQLPWPLEADGLGATLVLKQPSTLPDHDVGSNWRASLLPGGNPGGVDSATFTGVPGDDNDGDGLTALAEYGFGSSDNDASDTAFPSGSIQTIDDGGGPEDYFTITYTRNLAADDVDFTVQVGEDLLAWRSGPGNVEFVSITDNGDGTATVVYRSAMPVGVEERQFMRVLITLQ